MPDSTTSLPAASQVPEINDMDMGDIGAALRAGWHDFRRAPAMGLFFALIYNASGVPVAAGVLFPFFGILISPMFAAFAMSASSISVVLNSLRLRGARI